MQRHGSRSKRIKTILVLALIALTAVSGCKSEREDAATQLISAFANGCHSQGEWTQAALSQTRALEQTILSLQANDKCKGVANALTSVQSLSGELSRLASDPAGVGEKEALETKRQLLVELSQASDTATRDALAAALAQSEVTLAQARAKASVSMDEQGNTSMVRGMTQMSGYLSTLLSSQTGLSECAHENPMLGVQIGAGVLAIAGTFVAPPIGAAVTLAGSMLSGVVDFARRENLGKNLRKVKAVELDAALACGLESMSNTYCEAQDLYSLIRLQAESYPEQWKPTRFWAGLDLWSRKVPRLIAWVNKVATGLTPTDPATASRQNQVWSKVHNLQAVERTAEGIIAQTERLLQSPPETERGVGNWEEKIVRHALSQLTYQMFLPHCDGGKGCTPIAEYYTTQVSLLYKVVQNALPPNDVNQQRTVDTIELPRRGFAEIRDNARVVFAEVSQQLMANLHLVVDVDPSGLLRDALMPENIGQVSPLEVTRDLIAFLDESAVWFESMGTAESAKIVLLIRETQALLADAATLVLTAPGNAEGDRKVIIQLFDKLQLIYGTDFLSGRIYRHIKWDLNTRIDAGQFPRDVTDILRASGKDAAREMTGAGGSSLDELLQDISTAQSISQRNVENFVGLFEEGLAASLKRLGEAADRAGEPQEGSHRPNRMLQARICTLVLTTSHEWPKDIDRRLCDGTVLESIYPGIPEKLRFTELEGLLRGQPLSKRMCTYQHFLRRSRLFATRPPTPALD